MSDKNIQMNLNDLSKVEDLATIKIVNERMSAGPKKTKIIFKNSDTGEVLGEYENKLVISGSVFNAKAVWGIDPPCTFPSYNDEMEFEGSLPSGSEPLNAPKVCLFCVDDSGCGATPKDVYKAKYIDRIKPAPKDPESALDFNGQMIMPFRFVPPSEDLNDDLRKYYFGRKELPNLNRVAYYFKVFDTEPQLHLRYMDGTQITENIYNYDTDQDAECFVETRLRITRLDFRDYMEEVLGWNNARISSVSLCYAWYDDRDDNYKFYQDIFPYTKLNFPYQWLVDSTMALDIIYMVYY